ncbi:50S ribosomal protein L19e, partial [Candidatus Woesearchaeota archaeon]|nr:50S ribosomal protein L19e [Candidatus Woesearchaeota archaeon]
VGSDRIAFNENYLEEISEAITKVDIKSLISQNAIKILPAKGVSRHRARKRHIQRKKGRRRGSGTRKGTAKARTPKKRKWINIIRAQRQLLKYLREKKQITPQTFRQIYKKAKGGEFRSKAHMKLYLERNNLLKEKTKK